MSTSRPSVTTISNIIQKYIGSDYDIIKELSDNLPAILAGTGLTLEVDYNDEGFPQETLEALLGAMAVVIRANEQGLTAIPDINSSVSNNTDAIAAFLTEVAAKGDTDLTDFNWFLNENDMASNSATKTVSQQSLVVYVAEQLLASNLYQGGYDATGNIPNLDSPAPGTIFKGYNWDVTVSAGDIFKGTPVNVGDTLKAVVDDPSSPTDWAIIPNNLNAASIKSLYESNANTNAFDNVFQAKLISLNLASSGDESLYVEDSTRGDKLLSTAEPIIVFNKKGLADDMFLNLGEVISATRGFIFPKAATIIGVSLRGDGSPTKAAELRINGTDELSITLAAGSYIKMDADIDVELGDNLQIFISGLLPSLVDAVATVHFKWRL